MASGIGIDLYTEEFDQEYVDIGEENVDLYEDVLSLPNVSPRSGRSSPIAKSSEKYEYTTSKIKIEVSECPPSVVGRRHQVYVGNLTWWTSDHDIENAISETGIKDFIEVKFFENRVNGQSKGYCVVSLKSEQSTKVCIQELPKIELHGRKPMVTYPTKQALNLFESQSKTRPVPLNNQIPRSQFVNYAPPPTQQRMVALQMMGPPVMHHPPPPIPGPMMHAGPPRYGPPRPLASNIRPPNMFQGPPPPRVDMRGRDDWQRVNNRPPYGYPPPQSGPPPIGPLRTLQPLPGPLHKPNLPFPPPGIKSPTSFSQPGVPGESPSSSTQASCLYQPPATPRDWVKPIPSYLGPSDLKPPLTDQEFDDSMASNRAISSTAIARAVSDTACGEYFSAIETLSTAIMLIKQSKVAQDDRCKILISSLQDTLHGVENKRFSSPARERSRSKERGSRRSHERERSVSRYRFSGEYERSRERYPSEMLPEKDRRYRDSYDDIDRDRDVARSTFSIRRPRNKSPDDDDEWNSKQAKRSYFKDIPYKLDKHRDVGRYEDRDYDRERRSAKVYRSRH